MTAIGFFILWVAIASAIVVDMLGEIDRVSAEDLAWAAVPLLGLAVMLCGITAALWRWMP